MRAFTKVALLALSVVMVATAAPAADLAPQIVVTDPQNDHSLWFAVDPNSTPPFFDLRGGFIAETDETIDFIWQYWDIPDASGGIFEGNHTYWEFSLDDPDEVTDPVLFSLRARPNYPAGVGVHLHWDIPALPLARQGTGVGPGGGSLQGNCITTGTVISCSTIEGSHVKVVVDDIQNTITAKVRRIDLRDPSDGSFLAVDGAKLIEATIFQGIATCQGVLLISAANCDTADMTLNVTEDEGAYILGQAR